MNSLRSALDEAFGSNYKSSVMEQKPLAIYLHRDDGIACNIFAQNVFIPNTLHVLYQFVQVMCSDAISSLLNGQFIVFPWDMTENENRAKFYEWLIENSLLSVKDIVKATTKDDYPLLLLLAKDKGVVNVDEVVRGKFTLKSAITRGFLGTEIAECVMEKLMNCLDNFQKIKSRIAHEEQSRLEREAIRQEQVLR